MESVTFVVPGRPQGKGRPRAALVNGKIRMYTPNNTAQYENTIAWCWKSAAKGKKFAAPVRIEIIAYFEVPKSYPKKRAELCRNNVLRPSCKPDGDNILKAVADALNGLAYDDDKDISDFAVSKRFGYPERLLVRVHGELMQQERTLNDA